MNKREIKKKLKAAAKQAGVHISWRELDDMAEMVIMAGGFHELAVEAEEFGKLKQYIGTKIIEAAPALRIEDVSGKVRIELLADKPVTMPTDTVDMGYKVIYPDGYESWSPQDVFEQAYRPTTGMNFGLALEAAKADMRIARDGWNGKGMYVFLADVGEFHTDADLSEFEDHDVECSEMLVLRTAQGSLQPGWLASQEDMLADDWYVLADCCKFED